MTKEDFAAIFKEVEGKPVNIEYGKQTFQKVVLIDYSPALAIVKTTMKGVLNTRAIKTIVLCEISPQKPFKPAKPVQVVHLPTMKQQISNEGCFKIVGKYCGHWKKCLLLDRTGEVLQTSPTSFFTKDLIIWAEQMKEEIKGPDILIDDTYCFQQYFSIASGLQIHV